METSPVICTANQRAGFYIGTSVMKELILIWIILAASFFEYFAADILYSNRG